MRIFDFLKALLPRLNKNKILEDLRITSSELETIAIPSYQVASEHFKLNKPESEEVKELINVFYSHFNAQGGGKKSNLIEEISKRLPFVKENTDYILEQSENLLEKDIIREGLTAKKTILIRAAENLSFISRHSLDLLNYIYTCEANQAGLKVEGFASETLAPGVSKHIQDNMGRFARILSDYSIPNKDFSKMISEVPEINVNDKNRGTMSSMYNEKDIDPLSGSQMQGFVNPIYHVRLVEAEWQASRYKANKEKKKLLEYRLLQLKMFNDEKSDPKLEEEIEYLQTRVDRLGRYLIEVEESFQ